MKDMEKANRDNSFKKRVHARKRNFDSGDVACCIADVFCMDRSDAVIRFKSSFHFMMEGSGMYL